MYLEQFLVVLVANPVDRGIYIYSITEEAYPHLISLWEVILGHTSHKFHKCTAKITAIIFSNFAKIILLSRRKNEFSVPPHLFRAVGYSLYSPFK